MNTPYKHSPFDPDKRQIRVVTLKPGAWQDEICCSIDVQSFDENPIYDALSYVWGDPSNQKPIRLNDNVFEVTENLWVVLRRLRDPQTRRVLWVDAICIDQSNKEEKSQQVAMMGEIYRGCQSAIVWLGEDFDVAETGYKSTTASHACEMLELLGADKHLHELPCFSVCDGNRTEISDDYVVHFEAFRKLVAVPWWKRIWVIQEMVLPQHVKFLYASEEFSYERLKSVVLGLQLHGLTCCKQYRYSLRELAFNPILTFQEQVEPMVATRETWTQQSSTTLYHLRRLFSAFQATEKRDLFYALLGLVTNWGSNTPLYPNYGISSREAIIQAVFKCISEQGGIEFLQGERFFRDQKDMPSWIPDAHLASVPPQWVMVERRRLNLASEFPAATVLSQNSLELSLTSGGTLLCPSLRVDKIVKTGPTCDVFDHFGEAPEVLRQWMEMVGIGIKDWPEQPPSEDSLPGIFWRTLINNSVELDTTTSPFYRRANGQDYAELRSLWLLFLSPFGAMLANSLNFSDEAHDNLMSRAPSTIYHLCICLQLRRMVITENGSIGLAPFNADPGDEIHVLPGSSVPFILRLKGGDDKKNCIAEVPLLFTIIGNGYFHNILFGNALNFEGEKEMKMVELF